MKKVLILILIAILVLNLGACSFGSVPRDWEILSFEDAKALYHSVDFTKENIGDYLVFTNEVSEQYNDWGELHRKSFYNGVKIPARNFIQFGTPDDEFLMDISYTVQSRSVQLDPDTLEEIGTQGTANTRENRRTISSLSLNRYIISEQYSITYTSDGTPELNDNGQLWVTKNQITDWKVERVRGHAEWIADIPDAYFMLTENHTPPEGAIEGSNIKFVVIEGEKYYYCYESYDRNDSYQCKGFSKRGNSSFLTGCISFLRGKD